MYIAIYRKFDFLLIKQLRVEKVGIKGCKDISFLSQNNHIATPNSK